MSCKLDKVEFKSCIAERLGNSLLTNIFLYDIHWNTSGILGIYSIIFSKSDPKLDKIWKIGHISGILRNTEYIFLGV